MKIATQGEICGGPSIVGLGVRRVLSGGMGRNTTNTATRLLVDHVQIFRFDFLLNVFHHFFALLFVFLPLILSLFPRFLVFLLLLGHLLLLRQQRSQLACFGFDILEGRLLMGHLTLLLRQLSFAGVHVGGFLRQLLFLRLHLFALLFQLFLLDLKPSFLEQLLIGRLQRFHVILHLPLRLVNALLVGLFIGDQRLDSRIQTVDFFYLILDLLDFRHLVLHVLRHLLNLFPRFLRLLLLSRHDLALHRANALLQVLFRRLHHRSRRG